MDGFGQKKFVYFFRWMDLDRKKNEKILYFFHPLFSFLLKSDRSNLQQAHVDFPFFHASSRSSLIHACWPSNSSSSMARVDEESAGPSEKLPQKKRQGGGDRPPPAWLPHIHGEGDVVALPSPLLLSYFFLGKRCSTSSWTVMTFRRIPQSTSICGGFELVGEARWVSSWEVHVDEGEGNGFKLTPFGEGQRICPHLIKDEIQSIPFSFFQKKL